LLDWSLLGFRSMFESEAFLLIHLDQPGVADFVRERAAAIGIRHPLLVPLAEPTRGQAETVLLGLDAAGAGPAEEVTIFNIDTIRPGVTRPALFDSCDGWLECFEGEGDHWSFVRPGPDFSAVQVTEKIRISSLCCSGLYHFRSTALFREAYARELAAPSKNELYVAPMYQHMIAAGQDIRYGVVPPERIFFSGTPDEYEDLKRREGELVAAFA
jgi:hypothetical protein